MSQSFDISTCYDALDETAYDIFDMDAYCSSLSPSVPNSESVPDASTPASHAKRYPKTCGHPRPSPAVVSSPSISLVSAAAVPSTPSLSPAIPTKPSKGKGRQHSATSAPATSSVDPLTHLYHLRRTHSRTAHLLCADA